MDAAQVVVREVKADRRGKVLDFRAAVTDEKTQTQQKVEDELEIPPWLERALGSRSGCSCWPCSRPRSSLLVAGMTVVVRAVL